MKDAQVHAPGAYVQKVQSEREKQNLFLHGSSTPQEEEHRKTREKCQAHQKEAYSRWRNESWQAFKDIRTKGGKWRERSKQNSTK